MRLFRRRDEVAATTPDPEGPALGASADAEDDGVAREPKQPTGDWMTLPPLAPTFRAMPTTFRVQTLPEILTSHADTRLSGSLGHAVSRDAPSGSISGLTSRPGDGLTHAGDVSRSAGGGGELPLREPHHEPAPVEPAIEVRRLADPSPISTSSSAPLPAPTSAPNLPAPTVSRSLLDTAPLVARPAADRPLPVARVVDAPAAPAGASAAPSVPSAPASLSSEPAPADVAPLAGDDDRVGGFGVGSEDLGGFGSSGAPADDVPRIAAPPELAPPIQPRRIQRSLDADGPTARPSNAAPLVGEAGPGTSIDPVVAPTPGTTPGAGELPLVSRAPAAPAAPAGDLPISRLADPAASSSAPSGAGTTASDPSGPSAPAPAPAGGSPAADGRATGADLPVSRLADGATPLVAPLAGGQPLTAGADGGASPSDDAESAPRGELPLFRATPISADGATAPVEPPIQRLADTGAAPAPGATGDAGGASLLGDAPLATAAADAAGDDADGDDPPSRPPSGELPLVHPHRGDDDTGPSTSTPTSAAPTLGADAEPMVSVQPMADTAGATSSNPSPGTAGLPLAPSDLGPSLSPPHRPAPDDVQRLPEASSATRPLVSPTAIGRATAAAAASAPRLDVPATATSPTATLPFVRPIGAGSSGLGLQRSGAGAAPMSLQSPEPAATNPGSSLPVQLRRLGALDVGNGVTTAASLSVPPASGTSAGPLPLAVVQRVDASSATISSRAGTSSSDAGGGGELPLHTPATAIPSAADIAVRAGLAERGPGGSLLTTAAPPASSFTIQREVDAGAEGVDAGGADSVTPVQRAVTIGGHRAASSASRPQAAGPPALAAAGGGGGGSGGSEGGSDKDSAAENKSLAAEAKKLYPFIRSALEADMRRQLEGKSRASRYRP